MHNFYGTALCKRVKVSVIVEKDQVMDKVIRKRRKRTEKEKRIKQRIQMGAFHREALFCILTFLSDEERI